MAKQVPKAPDMEKERRRLLKELRADEGADLASQYEAGSFGCHELLDRTGLLADALERYVLTHPACVQRSEWFALAETAVASLQELYQRIGQQHLDA